MLLPRLAPQAHAVSPPVRRRRPSAVCSCSTAEPPFALPVPAPTTQQVSSTSVAPWAAAAERLHLQPAPASATAATAAVLALARLAHTWRLGWLGLRARERRSAAAAPVGVFWDIENCGVPAAADAWSVAGAVADALRSCGYTGPLRAFVAFGDVALLRTTVRRQLASSGVTLSDVPSGRKDAADRALLLELLLFTRDAPPPATVLLITGDRDFAPAAHRLRQLGYTVLLAAPLATASVAPELQSAAHRRFDWASLACGLVPFEERAREGGRAIEREERRSEERRRPRGSAVGAFVAAAAAAIEREDVRELETVVAAAQETGLKTGREEALLGDLRRRLKRRDTDCEAVRAQLERAIGSGDGALAEAALLAARTRGVAHLLRPLVARAQETARQIRAAEESDEEEEEAEETEVTEVTEAMGRSRRAAQRLEETSAAALALAEERMKAQKSRAREPPALQPPSLPQAPLDAFGSDPAAIADSLAATPGVSAWLPPLLRVGLPAFDLPLLQRAVERCAAEACPGHPAALAAFAAASRARSTAGSLTRAMLTRNAGLLTGVLKDVSERDALVAALLAGELAEARAAVEAVSEPASWAEEQRGASQARVQGALSAEDGAALRAALLEAALLGGEPASEALQKRLKGLLLAAEAAQELQRAAAAGDTELLRLRLVKLRRLYLSGLRAFPAPGGPIATLLEAAAVAAEAVLAAQSAPRGLVLAEAR